MRDSMWPGEADTLQLLSQVGGGDAIAVEQLLARHRDALRRVVGLRLDPAIAARVDASDIVQETFIEAANRLSEFVEGRPMPFHLWLRRIALDRLIDAHRRHRQAKKRTVDREQAAVRAYDNQSSLDLMAQLPDVNVTPATAAMRDELIRRFQAAVEELEDDDREIILMRHFEHLTNSEVASALGLSEPAAGMRHLRAIRRLRALLGESEPTD